MKLFLQLRIIKLPLFQYKALNSDNEVIEGDIDAANEQLAITKLQEMSYFLVSIQLCSKGKTSLFDVFLKKKIPQNDILILTQKLAVIMKAGLNLDAALVLLKDTASTNRLQHVVEKLILAVHNGRSLSEALQEHPLIFDPFYINTVKSGEATGTLDKALNKLSKYLLHTHAIKRRVQSALIYPVILAVVACATLLILLIYVVPQFQTIFSDMGQALPLSTQIVISIADFIKDYGWLLLIIIVSLIPVTRSLLNDKNYKIKLDQIILRLPILSNIIIQQDTSKFCRSLGDLIENNVPVIPALSIVADSLNNLVIRQAILNVKKDVQEGRGISISLKKQAVFPMTAVQLIKVGEESGELATMLEQVADIYDDELQDTIQKFLSLLEPIMIIGLGIVIAGIIISVLLAILSLNEFAI